MKLAVVVPTYNEIDNISLLIQSIHRHVPTAHVLVVDDSSPDGTAQLVAKIGEADPRVFLIGGRAKEGLAAAYLIGFKWCFERNYDAIVQMDADFSHRPEHLPDFFEKLKHFDLVIGCRYAFGGGTKGWPWYRQALSRFGNLYARTILRTPYHDMTGGFNGWRTDAIKKIMQNSRIISHGYVFQVELKTRAYHSKMKVVETPIVFDERRLGQSKINSGIMLEAARKVIKLISIKNEYSHT